MVSLHEEKEPNERKKEQRGAEAPHLSEPLNAHLTAGEFVVVAYSCGCMMLRLTSRACECVQAVRRNFEFLQVLS